VTSTLPSEVTAEGKLSAAPDNAKAWHDIISFYRWLVASGLPLSGMVALTEQIIRSPYHRLYAWTSMHALCLAQTPRSLDVPYLKISPLFDGRIAFRYLDTYVERKQWTRTVPEDAAFLRFERF
jgi:hypothetical protein